MYTEPNAIEMRNERDEEQSSDAELFSPVSKGSRGSRRDMVLSSARRPGTETRR